MNQQEKLPNFGSKFIGIICNNAFIKGKKNEVNGSFTHLLTDYRLVA